MVGESPWYGDHDGVKCEGHCDVRVIRMTIKL